MENNLSVKNKVNAVLNSMDNVEQAIPSPYFYTKIFVKINTAKITIWEKWSAFFLRPTIAFATIIFIVVINAFVVYSKMDGDLSTAEQTEVASSDEYNETVTALYDLENVKP